MSDAHETRAAGAGLGAFAPAGAMRLMPVAISRNGERMLLHFSAISGVLSKMHNVPPDLAEVTRSRLKYFQTRGFPLPGGTRGKRQAGPEPKAPQRRGKANIGMDDALKLAFAFELLESGMGPTRVIRLAVSDWAVVRPALAAAWWRESGGGGSAFDLAIAPRALAELKEEQALDEPLSETLGPLRRGARPAFDARTLLTIDLGRMAVDFGAAATGPGLAEPGDFDRAMVEYCAQAFGTADRSQWRVKPIAEAPEPQASTEQEAGAA